MRDPIREAQSLIAAELAAPGAHACVTASFQAEDVALVHLLVTRAPEIPVLFLDTGYHFPEVLAYRDELASRWGLNLKNQLPAQSVAEQESAFGILYQSDPGRCCHLRKVEPLMAGLAPFNLWFTGLRREQSPTRAGLQPLEAHRFPNGQTLRKLSPLYDWTIAEVNAYLAVHEIPLLALYEQGYTSIGCAPCTAAPEAGTHARSGRWGGRKLECGLHTVTTREN
jgi:phosphoadenosine phosphosulfate reductase